jgi:glycosyltransferase involved in cell wall biosynthesis
VIDASVHPRVSVVLPARNAATTLHACLASIVRQTLADWECVIVDDGSTDATREIACEAARRDGRFHVVATAHRGLVAALNEALRHCRAPLVARMDADDVMHRDRLAAQAAALENDPALSAVGCHVRLFSRAPMSPRLREYEAWLNSLRSADDVARDAFVECPVAHPTLMMRREVAALGYADRGWPEDYDLILRALGAGMRIGVVSRRLLSWRDRPGSLSRTDERYSSSRFTACKAHYLAEGFLSASDRYVLWGYGRTGRALRAALAALGKHPSFIVEVKKTRLGQRIHGSPVIAPEGLRGVDGRPLVVSVAREGPRTEIRAALSTLGLLEGKDYVCAA